MLDDTRKEIDRILQLPSKKEQLKACKDYVEELRHDMSAMARLRGLVEGVALEEQIREGRARRSNGAKLRREKKLITYPPDPPGAFLHWDGGFKNDGQRMIAIGELVARREDMTVGAIAETLRDAIANVYRAIHLPGFNNYFIYTDHGITLSKIGKKRFPVPKDNKEGNGVSNIIEETEVGLSLVG